MRRLGGRLVPLLLFLAGRADRVRAFSSEDLTLSPTSGVLAGARLSLGATLTAPDGAAGGLPGSSPRNKNK